MSKREWPLLFAVFLDLVGFGMAFPDLQFRAEILLKNAGVATDWIGFGIGALLASYFAVQMLASPRWGKLSDRLGRKPVLLVCTGLSACSMLSYAFAQSWEMILLSRVLAGMAAANVVVANAYFADIYPSGQREAVMRRVGGAVSLGLFAGPAIGGYLAETGGSRLMGFVAAIASFVSFLWILFGVPSAMPVPKSEAPKIRPKLNVLFSSPQLTRLCAVTVLSWFALACLDGTFGRLIHQKLGYGQREFGLIFSYESILGTVVTWFILKSLQKRFSRAILLRVSLLLQAVGLALTPFAPSLLFLFFASTLYAFGSGCANPTINTACSDLAPADRQGELFGAMQAARSIGFLIGPMVGGKLFDMQPEAPYLLAGVAATIAAILIPTGTTLRTD